MKADPERCKGENVILYLTTKEIEIDLLDGDVRPDEAIEHAVSLQQVLEILVREDIDGEHLGMLQNM